MWQGVWALVLLLYAPLVHTCVMLLKCPMIADNDGDNYVGVSFINIIYRSHHEMLITNCLSTWLYLKSENGGIERVNYFNGFQFHRLEIHSIVCQ